MFTKRNFVKFTKDMIVLSVVTNATNVALSAILDEQDDVDGEFITTHDTASMVTGTAVCVLTRSYTDGLIDRVADWRQNRKVEEPIPAV